MQFSPRKLVFTIIPRAREGSISLWCLQNVSEVSAQNTPQIIYYSLSNLPLFGCEQKHAVFVCVPLNANELLLPPPFQKRAELYRLALRSLNNNKAGESHAAKMRIVSNGVQPYTVQTGVGH